MKPRKIEFAASFAKAVKDLPADLQQDTRDAVKAFRDRSRENALAVEKKSGLKGIWAFRVDRGYRVFFRVMKDESGETVNLLIHVGHHDDYRTIKQKAGAA